MKSVDEYIELMDNLKLPNPKMMDVAVPANMHVGLHQEELAKHGLSMTARDAIASLGRPDILLVDLRETGERNKHGMLAGALHAPYGGIEESLRPGGMLREVAAATGRRVVFFCAFGERSAMAVKAAKDAGLANTAHIEGGMDAWKKAGGPVVHAATLVLRSASSRVSKDEAPAPFETRSFGPLLRVTNAVSLQPSAHSARPPETHRRIRSYARE